MLSSSKHEVGFFNGLLGASGTTLMPALLASKRHRLVDSVSMTVAPFHRFDFAPRQLGMKRDRGDSAELAQSRRTRPLRPEIAKV